MRIIVTGASGVVGETVTRCLRTETHHTVHPLQRRRSNDDNDVILADVQNCASLSLPRADACVHCARDMSADHSDGDTMFVRKCHDAGVRLIVFTSSTVVYTPSHKTHDKYTHSKQKGEREITRLCKKLGITLVMLRISIVDGTNRHGRCSSTFRLPVCIDKRVHVLHVYDLYRCIRAILEDDDITSSTFNVLGKYIPLTRAGACNAIPVPDIPLLQNVLPSSSTSLFLPRTISDREIRNRYSLDWYTSNLRVMDCPVSLDGIHSNTQYHFETIALPAHVNEGILTAITNSMCVFSCSIVKSYILKRAGKNEDATAERWHRDLVYTKSHNHFRIIIPLHVTHGMEWLHVKHEDGSTGTLMYESGKMIIIRSGRVRHRAHTSGLRKEILVVDVADGPPTRIAHAYLDTFHDKKRHTSIHGRNVRTWDVPRTLKTQPCIDMLVAKYPGMLDGYLCRKLRGKEKYLHDLPDHKSRKSIAYRLARNDTIVLSPHFLHLSVSELNRIREDIETRTNASVLIPPETTVSPTLVRLRENTDTVTMFVIVTTILVVVVVRRRSRNRT